MAIGNCVLRQIPTADRRLWGQLCGTPSGVAVQSAVRMRAPISPPPERKSGVEAGSCVTAMKGCLLALKFSFALFPTIRCFRRRYYRETHRLDALDKSDAQVSAACQRLPPEAPDRLCLGVPSVQGRPAVAAISSRSGAEQIDSTRQRPALAAM